MRKLLIGVVLALVAGGLFWLYRENSLPPEIPFAAARIESIVDSLSTNGKVEPVEWASARAEREGVLRSVTAEKGRNVAKGAPLATEVLEDNIYFLTPQKRFRLPITPPPFQNHGNYIISLNQFTKWLAGQVEAEGIDLFMGFAAQHVLYDGARVIGVRLGDRGIGKDARPKAAFEPGADIHAKVTIFADGVRGHLTKQLTEKLDLDAHSEPAQFAIGIKEVWEIPKDRLKPGTVIHTLGYPLKEEEFGGTWLYAMPEAAASMGSIPTRRTRLSPASGAPSAE